MSNKESDLLVSQCLLVVALLLYPGDVAGQFAAAPPTCPGDVFTFQCTVVGDIDGITTWRVNGSSECPLSHRTTSSSICGPGNAFTARSRTGFGISDATSFTSTLSGTADTTLNGALVECFGPDNNVDPGNMVGDSILQILGPPSVPTLSCVDLSEGVSGAVNITVSWTLSGGDSVDFYLIAITTNAPQTPYRGLLNITTASVTQYELTGFQADYQYHITVRGVTVNCGGLEGSESEPLIITPEVPIAPRSCNITLSYNQLSGRLQFINSTWDTMLNPVDLDPGEVCPAPRAVITQYLIRYRARSLSGPFVVAESVDISQCNARMCRHPFEPDVNRPILYDNVSVAGDNMVGIGAERICTAQTINTTNDLLTGGMVDASSPNNATINCTFLSEFNGSARCAVHYGTDPTYMNLLYSAVSTESGIAGDSVSVVLRERLNSSTVYYYTVSAVSGDVTVVVQATFTTPLYNCSPVELWDLPAAGFTLLGNISSLNDTAAQYPICDDSSVGSVVLMDTTLNTATVAYLTGTTLGSMACFVCDEDSGYGSNTTSIVRVCQNDGTWSGTPITCDCTLLQRWHIALIVIGPLSLVSGIVLTIVLTITAARFHSKKVQLKCIIIILLSSAAVFIVLAVALWIAMAAVVSNPTNGNFCNSSWRQRVNGLMISGFMSSILSLLLPFVTLLLLLWKYCGEKCSNLWKGRKPLHLAARQGNLDTVKLLVSEGADINVKDNKRWTPLHHTARGGYECTVEYLVKKGANINAKDNDEQTPLHIAAKKGYVKTVQSLVNRGADINIKDKNGMLPLHVAATNGRYKIVEHLVGQDVADAKDNSGWTPLHLAAREGHMNTVESLVSNGANTNTQDNDGRRTPLHLAAREGHMNTVESLIDNGANIDIQDHQRQTPLHLAARGGHMATVQLLVGKQANTNIQDINGMTAQEIANQRRHMRIAKFLGGAEEEVA